FDEAASLLERALALFEGLGDQRGYAWALHYAGQVARATGQHRRAAQHFAASLEIFQQIGDAWYTAESLAGLANAIADLGQPALAARLRAAAPAELDQAVREIFALLIPTLAVPDP